MKSLLSHLTFIVPPSPVSSIPSDPFEKILKSGTPPAPVPNFATSSEVPSELSPKIIFSPFVSRSPPS